ncbi:MAG: aminodeoxychorismate/anthranilate synthase component II [Flavobacteriales bacterium]|nr:aminodeoxychorismate/anthranilate synthase component II [Flavobacteriales bacterium]
MKILVIDNYDSFTYNLVHYLEMFTNAPIKVYRNNQIRLKEINQYDKIVLSPGPGLPDEAGILIPLIKEYAHIKSILGICLGQQAIAQAFGGTLQNLQKVYHGVKTPLTIIQPSESLFENIPNVFMAGRYHSWVVNTQTLPQCLQTTVVDEEGHCMGFSHKIYNVKAVQFHPESILTEHGKKVIENWLKQ